ncbi:MAG: translocation and assembly module TamA [Gammaproteobacteria bacterium]|jgi:translocation and assembly module TamA
MTYWIGARRIVLLMSVLLLLEACALLPNSAAKKIAALEAAQAPRIGLELNGVDDALAENVRAHLSISSKPCTVSRAYLRALGERATEETEKALQAFGYYAPEIQVAIEEIGVCPIAKINITPGEPVLLGRVDIGIRGPGESDPVFLEQLKVSGLNVGEPLNHGNYTAAKQLIESVALERGYLEGIFIKRQLDVDPSRRIANIVLTFDSGPRYSLGEILINQEPDFLDESLVRRFLEYSTGEPYLAASIGGFHRALSKGSYFNRVEVRPRLSSPRSETIPIDITLTPRDRHSVTSGVGASTDEGIRGRFGYQNRRLNHYGHQLDVSANASFIEQKFSTSYRIPRDHPVDEWLSLQAGIRRRDVDTFTTIESQFIVSETKRRPRGWMETRFIEFNREDYDVSATEDVSSFLAPGISWRRTVTNNALFPTRGYDVNFELKAAAEPALSDTSFARGLLSLASVYGLPINSRALVRGHFGALWVDDFKVLPPSERFFAGGDSSIRGYDIDSRGPVDASGDVIGGTYLGVVSVELEHYFTDAWGIATFVDSGNAFGGDGSSTGFQTGVGVGVRWRSPVGPVRLDIAHPLDDDNNDFRLHIRIGPDL